jgi:hypothetical protein
VPVRRARITRELNRATLTLPELEARTMSPMRRATSSGLIGSVLFLLLAAACDRSEPMEPVAAYLAPAAGAQGARILDVARCSPNNPGFTTVFTHPYFFPATVGHQSVLTGEEDGEAVDLQITVLDNTRNVGGVTTRVIEEREWIDGELREVSWNYYAQASDGSICYFGEDVDIFEEGGIVHDGAWCGVGGNLPGIFLPVDPRPGITFQMEVAPDVAMDEGRIVGVGPVSVPFGRLSMTIRVREFNPLDGDMGFKVFAQGLGLAVDGGAELTDVNQTSGTPDQPILTVQTCGS